MSGTAHWLRALGRALRVKINADQDIPAEMQAALLRLACADMRMGTVGMTEAFRVATGTVVEHKMDQAAEDESPAADDGAGSQEQIVLPVPHRVSA
jgi:hypothetical protein